MRLNGKTALVTGAASGFGLGIAKVFAQEGARVALADLNFGGAKAAADKLGDNAIALSVDVADGESIQGAVDTTKDTFGRIDIAVNNAGISHRNQPVLDVDYETFQKIYRVNVDSVYHMTQAIVPHWRDIGGGVMINVGSTAAIRPRPGLSWYNSTKGAVHVLTKSLALDFAADNIRICALAPVLGATGLMETFMGRPDSEEARSGFLATVPLGRLSTPDDLGHAAAFLASDEAGFLTGVILEIDGGRTI